MQVRLEVGELRVRFHRGLAAGARSLFKLVGQFFYANGTPAVGATVYLHDWPTMALVATTTTDANGAYLFYTPHNTPYRTFFHLAGAPNYFGCSDILVPS